MPTPQNEINSEIFNRINALEKVTSEMSGYFKGIVEQNDKLIKLFTKALYILATVAFLAIFALIYGAIGKDGLHAVRQAMPERIADLPGSQDFDRWRGRV